MIEIPQSPCKRGKFYKTEESTTAIQSAGKHQKGQPVRTQMKNTRNVQSAGKREWTRRDLFKFWIWLVEKVARFFLDQLHSDVKQNRRSSELLETPWKKKLLVMTNYWCHKKRKFHFIAYYLPFHFLLQGAVKKWNFLSWQKVFTAVSWYYFLVSKIRLNRQSCSFQEKKKDNN